MKQKSVVIAALCAHFTISVRAAEPIKVKIVAGTVARSSVSIWEPAKQATSPICDSDFLTKSLPRDGLQSRFWENNLDGEINLSANRTFPKRDFKEVQTQSNQSI